MTCRKHKLRFVCKGVWFLDIEHCTYMYTWIFSCRHCMYTLQVDQDLYRSRLLGKVGV